MSSIYLASVAPSSLKSLDPIPSISFKNVDKILVCNPDSLLPDESSLLLLEERKKKKEEIRNEKEEKIEGIGVDNGE